MSAESLFSKWLVISDIDGTLLNRSKKIPKKNFDAIADFVKKGGNFTLASSRHPESLSRYYNKLPISTPAIVTNGSGIYDFKSEEYVHFDPISQKAVKDICKLSNSYPTLDAIVITKDKLFITGGGLWSFVYVMVDRLTNKWIPNIDKVPKEDWGKVIINGPPWRVKAAKKKYLAVPESEFDIVDTSGFTFEILPHGINKGSASLKLADILGIEHSHTAAIGDYWNDLDMLKAVAVPACCGQAPKGMKQLAEYVACHCNDGAVADFIEYLINNLILDK